MNLEMQEKGRVIFLKRIGLLFLLFKVTLTEEEIKPTNVVTTC